MATVYEAEKALLVEFTKLVKTNNNNSQAVIVHIIITLLLTFILE